MKRLLIELIKYHRELKLAIKLAIAIAVMLGVGMVTTQGTNIPDHSSSSDGIV